VENVQLRLAAPFSLGGVVEFEGPPPTEMKSGGIVLESATHPWSGGGQPGPSGSFVIEGVYPDRYTIAAPARVSGYYVASIRIGTREVIGEEVDLSPGMPPLRVLFKPAAGRVTGMVEKGAGSTVVLVPKMGALRTYQYIRATQCDEAGRYEITGIRPGDYYAAAFVAADVDALEDPELIRALVGSMVSVQVDNAAPASVDLKLILWPE
jgi:hypothetical protein